MTPDSQRPVDLWHTAAERNMQHGYHQVRMLCKYRRGDGEVLLLKRKAASPRHLFTCTSNRRKIENVKIAH